MQPEASHQSDNKYLLMIQFNELSIWTRIGACHAQAHRWWIANQRFRRDEFSSNLQRIWMTEIDDLEINFLLAHFNIVELTLNYRKLRSK